MRNNMFYEGDSEGWAVLDPDLQKEMKTNPLSGSWWEESQKNSLAGRFLNSNVQGNYPYATQDNNRRAFTNGDSSGKKVLSALSNKMNAPDLSNESFVPDTLAGFGEGAAQYGKRWMNDMAYNWGRAQSWLNDEQLLQRGYNAILPEWKNLSQLDNLGWNGEINVLKRENSELVEKIRRHQATKEDIQRSEALNERIQAMSKIGEMRRSYPPEQIETEMRDWIQNGGPGMRRMRDARAEENKLIKPTKGWATAGEMAAGVAQQALPIAAGLICPPAAPALGALNLGSLAGQGYAQAHKTVDRYEEENSVDVPEEERMGYALLSTGMDFFLDKMMQGRYLKSVSAPAKRLLSEHVIEQFRTNPRARREMTDLVKRYAGKLNAGTMKGFTKDVVLQGGTESLSSVGHDIANVLYNHQDEFPELSSVFDNALSAGVTGAAMGGVLGGMSRTGQRLVNDNRRKFRGMVSVAEWRGQPVEVTGDAGYGMLDIMLPDGSKKTVRSSTVKDVRTVDYDIFKNKIPSGNDIGDTYTMDDYSPSERVKRKMVLYQKDIDDFLDGIERGDFDPSGQTLTLEERRRKKAELQKIIENDFNVKKGGFVNDDDLLEPEVKKEKNIATEANGQKYSVKELKAHAQDFLKRMKFDVDIYDTIDDIPKEERAKMAKGMKYTGYYTTKTGRSAIILDNIKNPAEIEKTILHEKMGHEGMRAILGDRVKEFYQDLFYAMPAKEQSNYLRMYGKQELAAEEYLAEVLTVVHPDPTFWDTAKANIRDAVRKRLGHDIRFSDTDLRYMLWKAKNRVQEDDNLENMIKKGKKNNLLKKFILPDEERFPFE